MDDDCGAAIGDRLGGEAAVHQDGFRYHGAGDTQCLEQLGDIDAARSAGFRVDVGDGLPGFTPLMVTVPLAFVVGVNPDTPARSAATAAGTVIAPLITG